MKFFIPAICYFLFVICHLSFVIRLARYLLFAIVMRFAGGIPLLSTRKTLSGQKNKPAQPFLCGLASLREFLFRL
jgi:hypothetical protein